MVPGFNARTRGAATTLFTNTISTGVILAGVMQGAVAELWPRQRLLDDRRDFAGDAVFNQQGERYLTVLFAPAAIRRGRRLYFSSILLMSPMIKM